MNRKDFFQAACPALVVGYFAASLESCSKEKETTTPPAVIETELSKIKALFNSSGIYAAGKITYLDLKNPFFEKIKTNENFINLSENGLLILRINDSYFAFDNCCPHQGSSNLWEYNNSKFRCKNHGNVYGIDKTGTAECSSNRTFGNLKNFEVIIIEQDYLKIVKP
jgi:nitrite reductase/ring-hydroxylating ferredoxin subunit